MRDRILAVLLIAVLVFQSVPVYADTISENAAEQTEKSVSETADVQTVSQDQEEENVNEGSGEISSAVCSESTEDGTPDTAPAISADAAGSAVSQNEVSENAEHAGIKTITGFEEPESGKYIEKHLNDRSEIDSAVTDFPKTINAILDDGTKEAVAVTWECTDDYKTVANSYYVFWPVWDQTEYQIDPDFDGYEPVAEIYIGQDTDIEAAGGIHTGNYGTDLLEVAKSQLGYNEYGNNGSKYGEWYGLNYAPWCAMFISWCAYNAGIPDSHFARTGSKYGSAAVQTIAAYYRDNGQFKDMSSGYTPKSGDLIFFNNRGAYHSYAPSGCWDHIGVVEYVDGAGYIHTIEGNCSNMVTRVRRNDSLVIGYADMESYGSAPNGYSISVTDTQIYDCQTVTVKVTGDGYNNISNVKLHMVDPNGGTAAFEAADGKFTLRCWDRQHAIYGTYRFYATVENQYGSFDGSLTNGSIAYTLKKYPWDSYSQPVNIGNDFTALIKNSGSGTYATVGKDDNVTGCAKRADTSSQLFRFIRQNDGSYKIVSKYNSKCLDVYGGYNMNDANIQTYADNGTMAQRYIIAQKNGMTYIRPCLSDSGVIDLDCGSKADNTNIHMYLMNGGTTQQFEIIKDDSQAPKGYSISVTGTQVYDCQPVTVKVTSNASNITNIRLHMVDPNGGTASFSSADGKFTLKCWDKQNAVFGTFRFYATVENQYGSFNGSLNNGCIAYTLNRYPWDTYTQNVSLGDEFTAYIRNTGSGTYATVGQDNRVTGAAKRSDNAGQIFIFTRQSDGSYKIVSKYNSKCLSVSDTFDGADILTDADTQKSCQRFIIVQKDGKTYIRAGHSDSGVVSLANAYLKLGLMNGGTSQQFEIIREQCTAALNANGGTVTPASITVLPGDALGSLPTPVRNGYTFNGWYTSNGDPCSEYTRIGADITLYAKWQANAIRVNGITLDKKYLTLNINDDAKLSATISPANADNKTVFWISDHEAVVSVDSSGNLHALSAGTSIITVLTNDNGYCDKCRVTVKPADTGSGSGDISESDDDASSGYELTDKQINVLKKRKLSLGKGTIRFSRNEEDSEGKTVCVKKISRNTGDMDLSKIDIEIITDNNDLAASGAVSAAFDADTQELNFSYDPANTASVKKTYCSFYLTGHVETSKGDIELKPLKYTVRLAGRPPVIRYSVDGKINMSDSEPAVDILGNIVNADNESISGVTIKQVSCRGKACDINTFRLINDDGSLTLSPGAGMQLRSGVYKVKLSTDITGPVKGTLLNNIAVRVRTK